MKRPAFVFGLCYFLFQAAIIFTRTKTLIIIAVLFALSLILCVAFLKQYKSVVIIVVSAYLCAFGVFSLYSHFVVKPIENLSGETANFTCTVTEITDGYNIELVNAVVRVDEALFNNGESMGNFSAKIILPNVELGDVIAFSGTIESITNDEKQYTYTDKIFVHITDTSHIELLGKTNALWYKAHNVQSVLSQNIMRAIPYDYAGVVAAMSLGNKDDIPQELRDNYTKAGLSHVLVVSGMHLGIIALLSFALANYFIKSRIAAVLAVFASFCFAFITGLSASSARAIIIVAILYGAKLICRKGDVFISLGLAAVIICVINPYASVDLSTLLSFSATFGVLVATTLLHKKRLMHEEDKAGAFVTIMSNSVAVPVCAMLATMPVLVSFGMGVSFFGVVANAITATIVPYITVCGIVLAVFSCVSFLQPIGMFFGFMAVIFARALTMVAEIFANLPYATVHITGLPAMICIFSAVALCVIGYKSGFKARKIFAFCAVFILMCGAFYYIADRDTVRIVRAGSAADTAIVVMNNFETAVIFSGRSTNITYVKEVLEQYNRTKVDVFVDLRRTHDKEEIENTLAVDEFITAEYITNSKIIRTFNDMYINVNHQVSGNYANINVGTHNIGVAHGNIDMTPYNACDIFIANSGTVQNLVCEEIWLPESVPDWVNTYENKSNFVESDINTLFVSFTNDTWKWGAKRIDYA